MNRYKICACIFFVLTFISCQKDLGNYNYTEIDAVQINNIEVDYEAKTLGDLNITPKISFQSGEKVDLNQFSYEWFTIDTVQTLDSLKMTKLGNESTLDYKVNLSPKGYPYHLYFRMIDKASGKQWVKKSKLLVRSDIGNGWLVLQKVGAKSRLDILNYQAATDDFSVYTDILKGVEIEGSPLLIHYAATMDLFTFKSIEQMYVGTDKKTYSFNVSEQIFNKYRMLNREILRPLPADFHAVKFRSLGALNSKQNYCLGSDGKLMFEYNQSSVSYSIGINRLQAVGEVKISPYFAEKTFPNNGQAYAMMYDVEKKRFIAHSGTGNSSMTLFSTNQVMIDPNNVGMDLIYMDYSLNSSAFYALLMNKTTNVLKLLRFDTMSSLMLPQAYDEVSVENGIEKADFYCIDPSYGYLLYAVGSKVFQYDPFNKAHKELLDLGTRKVSAMKFQKFADKVSNQRYKEYAKNLVIASYDPSDVDGSGKIEFYKVRLSALPELQQAYSGFGKIVDVSYRE